MARSDLEAVLGAPDRKYLDLDSKRDPGIVEIPVWSCGSYFLHFELDASNTVRAVKFIEH